MLVGSTVQSGTHSRKEIEMSLKGLRNAIILGALMWGGIILLVIQIFRLRDGGQ